MTFPPPIDNTSAIPQHQPINSTTRSEAAADSIQRVSSEQVASDSTTLFNRHAQQASSPDNLLDLLSALITPLGSPSPILEALYRANPSALWNLLSSIDSLFLTTELEKPLSWYCQTQLFQASSQAFFGKDIENLDFIEEHFVVQHFGKTKNESLADDYLQQLSWWLHGWVRGGIEGIKHNLSRSYYKSEAAFQTHVIEFKKSVESASEYVPIRPRQYIHIHHPYSTYAIERQFLLDNPDMSVYTREQDGSTCLPPEISRLTKLTELVLSFNPLSFLSDEIWQLTGLKKLYVNNNILTKLSPNIKDLTALQELGLRENKLESLPPEIGCLTQLRVLNIANNPLITLPLEIINLKQLTHLDLSTNQFHWKNLPPDIQNWLKDLKQNNCEILGLMIP